MEPSLAQAVLSNLKITIAPGSQGDPTGEIYGKVVSASAGDPSLATVRFTSTTPELKAWCRNGPLREGIRLNLLSTIPC